MRLAFVVAVVTMASLSGLTASELRLGAEIPIGPASQFPPGVTQTSVHVAYASGHTLAAWVTDNALFGALDGAPVAFSESNIFDFGILGIAGGRRNFLVVFMPGVQPSRLLARRVGFDGRILDPVSIVIPIDDQLTNVDGGVAYDGSEFVTVCTRKPGGLPRLIAPQDFATASVSDDGLAKSGSVFMFPSSTHIIPVQPRIAWTGMSFIVGFGFIAYTDDSTWGVSAMSVEREATINRTIGSTSFAGFQGNQGLISMAVGADRATFAWLLLGYSASLIVAQTDLDGNAVFGPKTLVIPTLAHPHINYGDVKIAWDGTEYLLAWIATNPPALGKIQGIRLGYDATPIDAEPFDISPETATMSLSLAPTERGFVIAYSRPDSTNGGVSRAFMRTLERLPSPPRRRAARR